MISVLSGGTGTPKLIQGIKNIVSPDDMSIIVNTLENDYFSGVYVAADVDTVLYTLSDIINDETWYGIKGDTFVTHKQLDNLNFPELLRIGDLDRATKIQKTLLLENHTLSEAVDIQRIAMGIESKIIPMSNENSQIKVITDIGALDFHDFLIKHQSNPKVLDIQFSKVNPAPNLINTIKNSDIVIIGPSNPITSIMPIISMDGVIDALKETYVVAISPIVGNSPVTGPAGKFMNALGYDVSAIGVCSIYKEFLNKFIIDEVDKDLKNEIINIVDELEVTNTLMNTIEDKENLAKIALKSYK
ncbi:MAG: 2-phospho-L-lactate transferase [Methanobrevibacter sp.]|jgi:LPPG:FO 2-phospho-L-lactate transferase|nr:2-phospho-L-lactate transferase [Candidatus Methanoflexus mossambicus]